MSDEGRVMLFIKPLPSENPDEWAIYIRLPTAPITGYFEHFTGVSFDIEAEARDYLAKCGQQSPAVGQEAVAYRYRFREGDWRVALDPLCDDEITDGWNQQALGVIGTPTPSRQEIEDVKDKRIAELEASLLAAQADSRRWNSFASSPQTALMLGSKLDPNDSDVFWVAECNELCDAALFDPSAGWMEGEAG